MRQQHELDVEYQIINKELMLPKASLMRHLDTTMSTEKPLCR